MRLRSMQELASMRLPRYIVRLEFYCLKDNFYLGSRGGDTIPSEGREAWKGRGFFFFLASTVTTINSGKWFYSASLNVKC